EAVELLLWCFTRSRRPGRFARNEAPHPVWTYRRQLAHVCCQRSAAADAFKSNVRHALRQRRHCCGNGKRGHGGSKNTFVCHPGTPSKAGVESVFAGVRGDTPRGATQTFLL